MTEISPEAVEKAASAFGAHVKAHSIPTHEPFGSTLAYAINPSIEECMERALTAALPALRAQLISELAEDFGNRAYRGLHSFSQRVRYDAGRYQVTADVLREAANG